MTDALNEKLRGLKVLPELDLVKDAGNVHIEMDIKPVQDQINLNVKVKL